jgi:hypothetical protein
MVLNTKSSKSLVTYFFIPLLSFVYFYTLLVYLLYLLIYLFIYFPIIYELILLIEFFCLTKYKLAFIFALRILKKQILIMNMFLKFLQSFNFSLLHICALK